MSLKKLWKKAKKTLKKVIRTIKEVSNRVVGTLEFLGSLIGIRPKKYLRLKVHILRDKQNVTVQKQDEVHRWLVFLVDTFKQKANVEVLDADEGSFPLVVTETAAPDNVLTLEWSCSLGDSFSDAADWFDDHSVLSSSSSAAGWVADQVGYGEAVHAFVIGAFIDPNKRGCAFPAISRFCVVIKKPLTNTLSHEVAHLCGLGPHSSRAHNLMNPDRGDTDSNLTRLQVSVLRNSPFVTLWRQLP